MAPGHSGISKRVSRIVGEPAYSARQTRRAPDVPRQTCASAGMELTQPAGAESFHPAAADGGFM
ncbi:hypothetical protein SBA4_7160008 [Candidatus Sulfopaludibacter sp. SbA4]|nr:hypothetical protein SBA4_7160008 [Candidatus Sulfopaludibacter sp. SbA4]